MKRVITCGLLLVVVVGCSSSTVGPPAPGSPDAGKSLLEARKGFVTNVVRKQGDREPVEKPPAAVFRQVSFDSPVGKLAAYLSPDPGDKAKHPAIIWITGGDCNSIGDVWSAGKPDNDQTAAQYRKAGVVMMFPSLRGGNQNPGQTEGFFGEVNDVLAAATFLGQQSYVDPARIYLGGHSTGGTLVLLTAAAAPANTFRAVFSFGPVADVAGYGTDYCPFDLNNPRELELRAPIRWLSGITTPTFVFEGTRQGNIDSLNEFKKANTNAKVQFFPVTNATHFSLLAPVNRLLATKVMTDSGPACAITVSEAEVNGAK